MDVIKFKKLLYVFKIDFEIRIKFQNDLQKIINSSSNYVLTLDSVRAFKERNKMGRFAETDPEELKRKEEEKKEKELQQKTKAEAMKVGDRYGNVESWHKCKHI